MSSEEAFPDSKKNIDEIQKSEVLPDESLGIVAQFINHMLTPGSSLSVPVWVAINIVLFFLFTVLLAMLISMPFNIHILVFIFLTLGLAASTNFFMYNVVPVNGKVDNEKETSIEAKKEK